MRKFFCAILIALFIIWPSSVFAADFKMNVNIIRQEDGTACGEFWYNDRIIWRLEFLCDGARPASGGHNFNTTTLVPDIVDGLFIIKVK